MTSQLMRTRAFAALRDAREDDQGGSPSVETAVLVAVVALVIAFALAGGRLVVAESTATNAARAGARAASIERTAPAAQAAATRATQLVLANDALRCTTLEVDVDLRDFGLPLGSAGAATVTVACAVTWSDLGLPAGAGTRTVEATATSPIDTWRERT